jgi:hypothetical protein
VYDLLEQLPEGEHAYWEAVRRMLGHLYSRVLRESGKRLFLDKTPRYYFILPELRCVFPRARFVFLLRNPIAVLASAIEAWAADDCAESLRPFRHDLAVAPGRIAEAIGAAHGNCAVVRYEDLAIDPEREIARLCGYMGIRFERRMIEYGRSEAGQAIWPYGDTRTIYRQSRPVATRVARWKKTLRSPMRKAWAHGCIETLGLDTIAALGYDGEELARRFPAQPGYEDAWERVVRSSAFLHNGLPEACDS